MKIHCESVEQYVDGIRNARPYSFAGYSDAEWYCMLGVDEGRRTGLGQILSAEHGKKLIDVMQRRWKDGRFLFAVPKCLQRHEGPDGKYVPGLPSFDEGQIDWWLGSRGIDLTFWERDMVLDDLARDAGLFPWVREFSKHRVCIIGPQHLDAPQFRSVIPYRKFVPIETPNLHMTANGIYDAAIAARNWAQGQTDVIFLVSAGVSAACIIDILHDWAMAHGSWCLDMGSVWDAFVGAGSQRQWRADLYANPEKWNKWLFDCSHGKGGRGW